MRRRSSGLACKPRERRCKPFDVAGRDQQAVLSVGDDVRHASDPSRDHGSSRRERFDRDHGRSLVRRGEHERVEERVVRRDVPLVAGEDDVARDAELVDE